MTTTVSAAKNRLTAAVAAMALAVALASACAPKIARLPAPPGSKEAYALFRQDYCAKRPDLKAVLVKASFTYTSPKPRSKTNRTVMQFFGDTATPLRLDVQAGIGTSLAFIRESRAGILAFYPDRKTAYEHEDPVIGAQRLGLPFPFSLRDLAFLLSGDFGTLTPETFINAYALPGGGFRFDFTKGRVRGLTLDAFGRPQTLDGKVVRDPEDGKPKDADPGDWTIVFENYPAEQLVPQAETLTLFMPLEEKGVLRIKSRELKVASWPAASLDLPLPAGTEMRRLDRDEAPRVLEMTSNNGATP